MMQAVNPHLAAHTPDEALEALKKQFKAYSAGDPPFDRKRRLRESPRSWWEQLLVHEDADVLAAIAVKIFSLMPTSMVDERAMSVVTWLNSPKRNRQAVATVANHLAIRNFMDFQNTEPLPPKLLTVNWRDMKKTIFGKNSTTSAQLPITPGNEPQVPLATEDTVSPSDMDINDPGGLAWLDGELPNLSTVSHYQFDLEQEFDIKRYLDILADEASGPRQAGPATGPASINTSTSKVDKSGNASTVAPEASAWDT